MTELTRVQCGNCGVEHAIPKTMYDCAYKEGGFWHCPNGHSRGWKEGAENQEIDKMRRARDRAVQEQARLAEEISSKEREIKCIKKRASAGTCQCCNRTFTNMARHMKTKHPEQLGSNMTKLRASK